MGRFNCQSITRWHLYSENKMRTMNLKGYFGGIGKEGDCVKSYASLRSTMLMEGIEYIAYQFAQNTRSRA